MRLQHMIGGLMEVVDDTSGEIADSHSVEAPAEKRT